MSRQEFIDKCRRQQHISELKRKRDKAQRKGYWTQEDIDWADKAAAEFQQLICD